MTAVNTMKILYLLPVLLFMFLRISTSQDIVIQNDNGSPSSNYFNRPGWEESVILSPGGPCIIKEIRIYYAGSAPGRDTIYIVGDPSESFVVPTQWVLHYNQIADPIIFDYDGTPGWYEFPVQNLKLDGYDRIIIQHILNNNGPWFAIDNNGTISPLSSWLMDPFTTNSLGGPGQYYAANGDFLVRLVVNYDYPSDSSSASPPAPQFVDVTTEAGIVDDEGNVFGADIVSAADWNGDGWDDIAIGSKFYENNKDGSFRNVTAEINITAFGTVWADVDNDGYMDCFAAAGNGNDKIYYGTANGTFVDDTDPVVVLDQPTVSPMWLDYNRDGLLDLFIAYGRRVVDTVEIYYPDQLFKNLGGRKFENITESSGIAAGEPAPYYDCWGASVCDYNKDNLPDIFVATYRLAPDLLYRNNGDGSFTEVGAETGARGVPTASPQYFGHGMGSDWGDYNNDGYVDLAIGNLGHPDWRGAYSNPSLILANSGPPNFNFINAQPSSGLKFFEMNAGIVWVDLNQDGYLDLFHCQYSYDKKGAGVDRFSRLYINQGPDDNYKLMDLTWELTEPVHGAWSPIRLDYDGDGDMDLLIGSAKENVKLYRNDMKKAGNWVSFRLSGSPALGVSADGFGTSVTLYAGGQSYFRDLPGSVITARASQASSELHFGIGAAGIVDSIVVKYSNGFARTYMDFAANAKYVLPYNDELRMLFLAPPQLQEPLNLSANNIEKTRLIWRKTGGTEKYEVQVALDPGFTIIPFSKETFETNIRLNGLTENAYYYWRVRSINSSLTSDWSTVWFFYVGIPIPGTPELLLPENNLTDHISTPLFDWSEVVYKYIYGNKTSYQLQISIDNSFENIDYDIENISGNAYDREEPLPAGETYYWRVRAFNHEVAGEWTETWDFSVMALPQRPSLISPPDDSEGITVKPTLKWAEAENVSSYHVQISHREDFAEIFFEMKSLKNNSMKIFSKLNGGQYYYWHVLAKNDGGSSDWSETFRFKTADPSAVNNLESISSIISNLIFSPNPFSDMLSIRFTMNKTSDVTISICNLGGIQIHSVHGGLLADGEYEFEWRPGNIESGNYICKIALQGISISEKIIYIR